MPLGKAFELTGVRRLGWVSPVKIGRPWPSTIGVQQRKLRADEDGRVRRTEHLVVTGGIADGSSDCRSVEESPRRPLGVTEFECPCFSATFHAVAGPRYPLRWTIPDYDLLCLFGPGMC